MTRYLFILNNAPYRKERPYNALRLAGSLAKQKGEQVRLFLMGDVALCAKRGQQVPQGFYNINLMLGRVIRHGEVAACGTRMDARGMTDAELLEGARRSTLEERTHWTQDADKVLVF